MVTTRVSTVKGGQKLLGDDAVFLFFRNDILVGIVCVHVDDIIATGDEQFHVDVVDEIRILQAKVDIYSAKLA